jgi:uncharacterized metal-binding protein
MGNGAGGNTAAKTLLWFPFGEFHAYQAFLTIYTTQTCIIIIELGRTLMMNSRRIIISVRTKHKA